MATSQIQGNVLDAKPTTRRQRYELLRQQLENERSSFLSHWRELGDYILPRRPRFEITDVNKGDKRNQNILDSTATLAARTTRSGMHSGVTSPARPWKRLTTQDPEVSDDWEVRAWLDTVNERMDAVFLRSNLYNSLPLVYGDMAVFGTAAMIVEEDLRRGIRTKVFPIGSYCISENSDGKVDTFVRTFRMTIRQLVEEFTDGEDLSVLSSWTQAQYRNGYTEAWVDVTHVIHPNAEHNEKALEARFKKYRSCYYETGTASSGGAGSYMDAESDKKLLRVSGYDYFPVLCPRWQTNAEDAYGTSCPGMEALPDIKGLQKMEKRALQAVEKLVNPPMIGPPSLKSTRVSILPGDITYSDEREGQRGLRPVHDITLRLAELASMKQETRDRIRRAFYEDLFLMLAAQDGPQMTAREIVERHEEKLLALGEVLEQINQDLLDPLIDITFEVMRRQGRIPPAPEALQGTELRVQYESIMAQAQKLVGVSAIERFTRYVGELASGTQNPETYDKANPDELIDLYAKALSVPTRAVRSDEEVAEIRAQRRQAAQANAMAQNMQGMARSAKDLSQASLEGDSALGRLLEQSRAGQAVPVGA